MTTGRVLLSAFQRCPSHPASPQELGAILQPLPSSPDAQSCPNPEIQLRTAFGPPADPSSAAEDRQPVWRSLLSKSLGQLNKRSSSLGPWVTHTFYAIGISDETQETNFHVGNYSLACLNDIVEGPKVRAHSAGKSLQTLLRLRRVEVQPPKMQHTDAPMMRA